MLLSLSDVSFRAQPGFRDFSSSSSNYHFYSTPVITANVTLAQARAGLVSQPTPGYPMSASEQGTKNDATPGIGGIVPGLYLSPVASLTSTNRLDGQPVVVNVTLGSHVLAPGVVVREAVPASGGGVLVQSWGRGHSGASGAGASVRSANQLACGPSRCRRHQPRRRVAEAVECLLRVHRNHDAGLPSLWRHWSRRFCSSCSPLRRGLPKASGQLVRAAVHSGSDACGRFAIYTLSSVG